MSSGPRPMQSECLNEDPLFLKASAEAPAIRLADLKNDRFPSWRTSLGDLDPLGRLGRLEPLAFARYLITFSIGVGVALAWQSYGNASAVSSGSRPSRTRPRARSTTCRLSNSTFLTRSRRLPRDRRLPQCPSPFNDQCRYPWRAQTFRNAEKTPADAWEVLRRGHVS
jgi:hypothetical protein